MKKSLSPGKENQHKRSLAIIQVERVKQFNLQDQAVVNNQRYV